MLARIRVLSVIFCLAAWGHVRAQVPVISPTPAGSRANAEAGTVRSASLLSNGDFAKADPSVEWPEGWGTKTPGNGVTWEAENGKHFLRLVSEPPGQLRTLYRVTKLSPGSVRAIRFSIRYRAVGIKAGDKPGQDARAWVAFEDSEGRTLDAPPGPLVFVPTQGWAEVSREILVPADASRCVLVTGLFYAVAGTLDIGEVAAEPLKPEGAAALAAATPTGSAAPAPSWVTNGAFSSLDADGNWPTDWGRPASGMSWQTEGNLRFVRVSLQNPGEALMLNKTVPLKTGAKGVELLIRWRATGVQHGEHEWFDARTIVHFLRADGSVLPSTGGDIVFTHKPAPTGWKESVKSYAVPEGASAMQLMSGLFKANAGTVDLAEFRVTPMNDATADLQRITSAAYGLWKSEEDAALDRKAGRQIEAQLAATGNLVPNGDFGEVDGAGNPSAWGKLAEGITWREERGQHFTRLISQNPQKALMLYRMVLLPLGVEGIEVKIRYRTAGIVKGSEEPGDARVVMHYLDGLRWGHLENGKEMLPQPADIVLAPDAPDWVEVSRRYRVPAGASKLQLMPGLWNVAGGTLDIAEIRVAPLSDADARALPPP